MAWLDGFFAGKVVAVTGASSGIGRETALAFGRAGARVAVLARRRDLLDEVATTIRDRGGDAIVVPVDVTDRAAVRSALRAIATDVWTSSSTTRGFSFLRRCSISRPRICRPCCR